MKYNLYQSHIPTMKNASKFDELINDFSIINIEDIKFIFRI